MPISRREYMRLVAGGTAAAALTQLNRASALAQTSSYRAMVMLYFYGGNDGWNNIIPTDARYAQYASIRGASIAVPQASVLPLGTTGLGLHPALQRLQTIWNEGAMQPLVNVGSLVQPLTRSTYNSRPDLRPSNLMSHSHEQLHWEGMRMQGSNQDGFLGRIHDRLGTGANPPLVSLSGSRLALVGRSTLPLVLPSTGTVNRTGFNASSTDAAVRARQTALSAFATASISDEMTTRLNGSVNDAYSQVTTANGVIAATTSPVDAFFRDANGNALTSDISRQLNRIARLIEARGTLNQTRQVFFAAQGGYDTHDNQADAGAPAAGFHANLLTDAANAMFAFYEAMKALGLGRDVVLFTGSDFGRIYRGNASRGTDHAWGNNQFIISQALRPQQVQGSYPDQALGGTMDIASDGRWIPGISIEQYVGAVASWFGVSATDMPYVFPNWSTWSSGGRSPLNLFT
jgi:uncharacterized protein (DUF1501 family)